MTKLGEHQINWTKTELDEFKKDWPVLQKSELILKYNRTYQSLKTRARMLKIKKSYPNCKFSFINLLKEENESYYWMGFIIADGCFRLTNIHINLHNKDYDHLCKFSNFIYNKNNVLKKEKYCNITVSDYSNSDELCNKFDLKPGKTYDPPKLIPENDNYFLCYLAGLIDGDGCFCKDYKETVTMIRIHCHSSYYDFYKNISDRLKIIGIESKVYFCSRGYLKFIIGKQKNMIKLYKLMLNLNIPTLDRKWKLLENIKIFKEV